MPAKTKKRAHSSVDGGEASATHKHIKLHQPVSTSAAVAAAAAGGDEMDTKTTNTKTTTATGSGGATAFTASAPVPPTAAAGGGAGGAGVGGGGGDGGAKASVGATVRLIIALRTAGCPNLVLSVLLPVAGHSNQNEVQTVDR